MVVMFEKALAVFALLLLGAHTLAAPGGHAGAPARAANSNDQRQPDANRGLDRAQERMSEQGKAHQQATQKANKPKKAKKPKDQTVAQPPLPAGAPKPALPPAPPAAPKPPLP
jgi:hypothetical protein